MPIDIIENIRKINYLLYLPVDDLLLNKLCITLGDIIGVNVFVLDTENNIIEKYLNPFVQKTCVLFNQEKGVAKEFFSSIINPKVNMDASDIEKVLNIKISMDERCVLAIVPINFKGKKLGTVITIRNNKQYESDEVFLIEYIALLIGFELFQIFNSKLEQEQKKINIVESAISSLSETEIEALMAIFNQLKSNEGILVTSKIADKAKITRSVIVNALKKFESAGILEVRSLGMKGTYIKVLNELAFKELEKRKG